MAYQTISGPIVTFNSDFSSKVKNLKATIDPVQDLHGYDNPWPAGGGKNLVNVADFTVTSQTAKSFGTFSAGTYTYSFNFKDNSNTNGSVRITNQSSVDISGTRINISAGSNGRYSATFTLTESTILKLMVSGSVAGYSFDVSSIMLELGSTATTYAPYSNICPISGWSAVNMWRTGKNLLDLSILRQGTFDNTISTNNVSFDDYLPIQGGVTYAWSTALTSIGGRYLRFYDADKQVLSYVSLYDGRTKTFTPPAGTVYYRAMWYRSGGITPSDITADQIQVGSTATPYEPYSGNQFTIQLGQTVYGGTLDVTNGVLTVDRASVDLGTLTDSGDTGWKYITNDGAPYFRVYLTGKSPGLNMICSVYGTNQTTGTGTLADKKIGASVNDIRVYLKDSAYTDLTTFISAMSGVQLVYELATPITIPLTPQQISTLQGQNNIWADCGDITLDYLVGVDSKPLLLAPKYANTVSGNIATFSTNITAPLKSCEVAINPVQSGSGDPSPDNVRPISGWTGANVVRTGKNLFDETAYTPANILVYGSSGEQNTRSGIYVNLPAGTYTLKINNYDTDYSYIRTNIQSANNEFISYASLTTTQVFTRTITINEGEKLVIFKGTTSALNIVGAKLQIESGYTASDYAPYTGNTYPIQLGQTVYGGTLDVTNGLLTVDREYINKTSCDGIGSVAGCFYVLSKNTIKKSTGLAISNYLKMYYGVGNSNNQAYYSVTQSGGSNYTIWCRLDDSYTTKDAVNAYLLQNPLVVIAKLATPITIPITTTQISALEGNNSIWADCGPILITYDKASMLFIS